MNNVYLIESSTLTGIASAIRSKTGTSSAFTPAQMITEIENIPSGGGGNVIMPNEYKNSTLTSYTGNEVCILDNAFDGCTSLTTASFPECAYIGLNAFDDCTSLTTVSFPECSYIGSNAFNNCTALTTVSFPKCSFIGSNAFYTCRNLISLYLNGVSSVPSLATSDAFYNTPLSSGGTGKIYVPSSLYNSFLTATNWSTLSARFVSM